MVLLVDNFDSFTYNLVQYFRELGQEVRVVRPGEASLEDMETWKPSHLVVSPGPGRPEDADFSLSVMKAWIGRLPVLGVCLGHQCLGVMYGAKVGKASRPVHGKTAEIQHDNQGVFAGLPNPMTAMRYHSLVVEPDSIPASLVVSARAVTGEVMGLRVKNVAPFVEGVQFHPESILTVEGKSLLRNFIALA